MRFFAFVFALITICNAISCTTPDVENDETMPTGDFNGVMIGADGRLIPSAYDKVKTFENGKKPIREVFVSPNGNDANGNGTMQAPYKTIAKGMESIQPGTAIRIMPGEYNERIARNNLYATEANPIWIGGVPGMERPKMVVNSEFMTISGGSYVIIHDMEVTHTPPYQANLHGFNIYSSGDNLDNFYNPETTHHFVLRGLYIHHIGDSPVKTAGVNFYWIFDCEVSYAQQGLRGSGSIDNVGSHNVTVAYNYLHNSIGEGIIFKGGSSNVDIHNNLNVNYGSRGVMMGQSTGKEYFRPPLHLVPEDERYEAKNIRTYSNIFIGGATAFAFASSKNCYAVNNTVINPTAHLFRILNNESGTDPAFPRLTDNGAACCGTIANNIFYYGNLTGQAVNVGAGTKPETFVARNNLFYNTENPNNKPSFGSVTEENSIFSIDPLFEDAESHNFSLKAESPAIDAGIDFLFVKEDFKGNPFKNPRSIGAIQY